MLSQNQVLHQGRYRIIHQFGQVESSGLYEAYDTVSDTKVVLRETSGQLGKDATPGQLETLKFSFAEEARRLSEIEHDALLNVKDYFSETDRQYIVMESVDGSDLEELLREETRSPAMSDILSWCDQILDALDHLHNQKPLILHQNITPQNIRLTSSFKIKLLATNPSVGIEERGGEETDSASLNYRSLEQLWLGLDSASQNVIANSFDERSQEILRKPVDARSDIYALGATIYHLFTKTAPVDALARTIDILDGKNDPLTDPTELNSSIPKAISEAVLKALEIKREERFETAAAMREALSHAGHSILAEAAERAAAQKQIRGETGRLDEEMLRVERQRLELEAEQKRLEEERLRIERKRAELEVEERRQAQIIEQERLAAEAKAAADVEKKRIEAEAAEEYKRRAKAEAEAAQRKSELEQPKVEKAASPLEAMQFDLEKDDLLDLPVRARPVPVAVQAHSDVLSLDEAMPSHASKPIHENKDLFSAAPRASSSFMRPAAILAMAAVLLIGIAGIWMFAGSGGSDPDPAAAVTSPASTAPPADNVQPEASSPVVDQQQPVPENSFSTPESPAISETDAKSGVTAAKDKPKKQPTPQIKPTPTQKKAVTVDDLINDN